VLLRRGRVARELACSPAAAVEGSTEMAVQVPQGVAGARGGGRRRPRRGGSVVGGAAAPAAIANIAMPNRLERPLWHQMHIL
jgi:hypothetical protein